MVLNGFIVRGTLLLVSVKHLDQNDKRSASLCEGICCHASQSERTLTVDTEMMIAQKGHQCQVEPSL